MAQDPITARVREFVRELETLINAAAYEAVEAVLSGAPPVKRPNAAPPPARAGSAAPRRKRGRPRKGEERARVAAPPDAKILGHLKSHPSLRVEELAKALAVPSANLKPRLAELVASKTLRTTGKTRGTKYSVT